MSVNRLLGRSLINIVLNQKSLRFLCSFWADDMLVGTYALVKSPDIKGSAGGSCTLHC